MKDIPKVNYDRRKQLDIEVLDFIQLSANLKKTRSHDPFSFHRIQFFLILIVTRGSYAHYVDFRRYKISAGSCLFIAKNQVHSFDRMLDHVEGICVVFNDLFANSDFLLQGNLQLNRLFNYHIESPILTQQEMGLGGINDSIKELQREYMLGDKANVNILRALLHVLLLKAERAKSSASPDREDSHWLEIFGKFKNNLESDYVSHRNSKVYASNLFVSYKTLNEIVKRFTGKTTKKFIDEFVTVEVKRYLASTSLSIKEISYKTGFDEPSNLVKFFKKQTGTTPLNFRQQLF